MQLALKLQTCGNICTMATEETLLAHSASAEETKLAGEALARCAQPGDIVLLTGDLGAGKTQFTQGFARGLGATDDVISPTFNLVLTYSSGRMPLHHFDLYRLEHANQLEDIALREYLESDGVCLVEWAEKFPAAFDEHLAVRIEKVSENERALWVRAVGARAEALLAAWRQELGEGDLAGGAGEAGETLWTPSSPFLEEERSARAEGEVAERDVSKASPAPQRAGESLSTLPPDGLPLDSVELVIMRHGATKGNEERRYVGAIDAPLTPLGCSQAVAAGIHPEVERVYVTTLIRSQQTAAICFPCAEQVIVDGLQEMDFGVFGGRTADEMVDDAEYRAWVDGYCEGQCPGGESREQVIARVCRALGRLVSHAQKAGEGRVIVVAHGGTMMAALDRHSVDHPERDYYEWNVPNCQGYVLKAQVTRGGTFTLDNCRKFEDLDFLNERL